MINGIPAPPGYYVPTQGAASPVPAAPGTYSPSSGAAAALVAPAGRYAPVAGMQATLLAGDLDASGTVSRPELDAALTNFYKTSPWLLMTNVLGVGSSNVTFALTNASEGAYTVLCSSNLVQWSVLGVASPRYYFTDTNAAKASIRYYRLAWP
jgi:hypothetical protein